MAREYQHIAQHEKEILELKSKGKTNREIAEQLGYRLNQIQTFMRRYKKKQANLAAGIIARKIGHPIKDYAVTEDMSAAELRSVLSRKEAEIKRLEMENELMRDFLSLTERK